MKSRILVAALAFALCAAPVMAQPGSPNTTPGTVTRIITIRITPGHADQFWADMRQHLKPVYDEQRRQGILVAWGVATKATTESPDDWNVVLALTYPNWAALDNAGARSDPITLAHYGSAANRTAAGIARLQHGTTTSSILMRDQTINPWK